MRYLILTVSAAILCGCATHTGVVDVGGGKYMIARQAATGFTGLGNIKAEIVAEARTYCAGQSRDLQILAANESAPPYILGNFPRAEIVFACARAAEPTRPAPPLAVDV